MSRMDELVRDAADAFEDGRNPFSTVLCASTMSPLPNVLTWASG